MNLPSEEINHIYSQLKKKRGSVEAILKQYSYK